LVFLPNFYLKINFALTDKIQSMLMVVRNYTYFTQWRRQKNFQGGEGKGKKDRKIVKKSKKIALLILFQGEEQKNSTLSMYVLYLYLPRSTTPLSPPCSSLPTLMIPHHLFLPNPYCLTMLIICSSYPYSRLSKLFVL